MNESCQSYKIVWSSPLSDRWYIFKKIFLSRIKYFCGQIRDEETRHYQAPDRYPGEVIVCFSQNTTQSHDLPVLSKLWQRPEERPCDGRTSPRWRPGPPARSSWRSPGHRNHSRWSPWSTGPAGGRWATPPRCVARSWPSPPPHYPRTSQACWWPMARSSGAPWPWPSSHIGQCHHSLSDGCQQSQMTTHFHAEYIYVRGVFFSLTRHWCLFWLICINVTWFLSECFCLVYFSGHWCGASSTLGPHSSTEGRDSGHTARPARPGPGADGLSMRSRAPTLGRRMGLQQVRVRPRPGPGDQVQTNWSRGDQSGVTHGQQQRIIALWDYNYHH